MLRITGVVKHLLIINVIMFLAGYVLNTDMLAMRFPLSDEFRPYQIATHFFMHAGVAHLFFNMFALVMFGGALEALWGPKRFLYFYFACAFGAALLHLGYNWLDFSAMQSMIEAFKNNPNYTTYWAFFHDVPLDALIPEYRNAVERLGAAIEENPTPQLVRQGVAQMQDYYNFMLDRPVVGASGAIYGLLLAFGMSFPNAELMLIFLPIPIKAKYFIPLLILVELFLGVNQFSWDNIAHFAHLGGALTGFLLILYWRKFGSRL